MKNFKQKFHHQVVEAKAEAMRVEAEVIHKLYFLHPWLQLIFLEFELNDR